MAKQRLQSAKGFYAADYSPADQHTRQQAAVLQQLLKAFAEGLLPGWDVRFTRITQRGRKAGPVNISLEFELITRALNHQSISLTRRQKESVDEYLERVAHIVLELDERRGQVHGEPRISLESGTLIVRRAFKARLSLRLLAYGILAHYRREQIDQIRGKVEGKARTRVAR